MIAALAFAKSASSLFNPLLFWGQQQKKKKKNSNNDYNIIKDGWVKIPWLFLYIFCVNHQMKLKSNRALFFREKWLHTLIKVVLLVGLEDFSWLS